MFFYSGRIRSLVALATYSAHRLIIGKVEAVSLEIFDFFFTAIFLSSHPRFIFRKILKHLLLRNHKGDEGETWHVCLGH